MSYDDMTEDELFRRIFSDIGESIHNNAKDKGFWPSEGRNDGEMVALIHSELSEMLEALRDGNPPSQKIPQFSACEEECADIIIRLLDMATAKGWNVGDALLEKMRYNRDRPFKHGREF